MKRTMGLALALLVVVAVVLAISPDNVRASSQSHVQVERVEHVVTPIYGGLLVINDTFTISSLTAGDQIANFSLGFPLEYRKNVVLSLAHDAGDEDLVTVSDTGLGTVGYYGVTVIFPDVVRESLSSGQPYSFTVTFVLSELVVSSSSGEFAIVFPIYPSLMQDASTCNVTVILPIDANYTGSDFQFDSREESGRVFLNYSKVALEELSSRSTWVSFTPKDKNGFATFLVKKLSQQITVDMNGHISASELLLLQSTTAFTLDNTRLRLPRDATNVTAFDELGTELNTDYSNTSKTYRISKPDGQSMEWAYGQSKSLMIAYSLNEQSRLTRQGSQSYELSIDSSKSLRLGPRIFTLEITLPEGATMQSFPQEQFSIHKDVFAERLSFSTLNTTWLQDRQWSFSYDYTLFWASFRPTLWATALAIVVSVIAFAWQRPKAVVPIQIVLVPRKTLDEFVETYEEKKKILLEIDQIGLKAKKGKMSRRRLKVRKTTLENKLAGISRRLVDLRQKITSGGAKYADTMRHLEIAETELDNIEADIRRIEVRFRRGEISAQTYRRLLQDDLRRKDRAKTVIDGVLIRMRE